MTGVLCIGQAVQDFVFHVDAMPAEPTKYRAHRFESGGGGPAATAAVAIVKLGGSALLGARLGDDAIAGLVLADLEAARVDCSLVRRLPGHSSSLSAVLVDDRGERLIINYLDDDMDTAAPWFLGRLPAGIGAVLADTRWPEGALEGLQLATDAGIPGVLDADSPVPRDGALLRAASHVAFSEPGLRDFAGARDPEEGLRTAAGATDAWCCVTRGASGTAWIDDGVLRLMPAFRVPVADTLGAGDVWHGAFALALAERTTLHEGLVFASAAAALKVRNGNGRDGAPTREEVDNFLEEQTMEATL